MDKDSTKKLHQKILDGLNLSSKQLIEEKKKADGKFVLGVDGKVVVVDAKDVKLEK